MGGGHICPGLSALVRACPCRSEDDNREVGETVSRALLEAAGPTGAINVSFRIFPDHVEVDVLRSGAVSLDPLTSLLRADGRVPAPVPESAGTGGPGRDGSRGAGGSSDGAASFAEWMAGVLRREGLTMEAAARQLGVSVKTVSRWVGGTTEPRLRDLRRIRELFGEIPFG
jgi:hypothetical protein